MRLLAVCAGLTWVATGQGVETFKTRLAPVAIDVAMKANIAGSGTATASLSGTKLTVAGKFEGLRTPATVAAIRQGSTVGVRGPVLFELTVSKELSGEVSGAVTLTPAQAENLKKGRWYIQIDSQKAPEGNLWGWLLK